MKKLFLLQLISFILIAEAVAADSVIITQVLYDPINSESGGEAVEIYNPTAQAIDVSGWVLATETSLTDVTFPANTVIGSSSYYLVADSGWSSGRDDAAWPEADHEETMTLTNTDAGVALINGSITIDAVGWGDALNIVNGLFEGNPGSSVNEGESLVRIKNDSKYVDSGDNSNDFTAATPDFHNSSFGNTGYSSSEIAVVAVVVGSFPVIDSFTILTDDDSGSPGNQINPVPKQNKSVEVEAVVTHYNGNGYVNSVVVTVGSTATNMEQSVLNTTSSLYRAEFNMSYYDSAGNYAVDLEVTDNGGFSANSSESFEYSSLIAMELDTNSLQFAAMPGMSSEIMGDADKATATNTTVQNIGNSVINIELSGTNLTASSSVIEVSNIQYTFNGDYNNSMAGILSHSKQAKQVGIEAASVVPLSFKLSVPTATAPGNYTGTITLIAVNP